MLTHIRLGGKINLANNLSHGSSRFSAQIHTETHICSSFELSLSLIDIPHERPHLCAPAAIAYRQAAKSGLNKRSLTCQQWTLHPSPTALLLCVARAAAFSSSPSQPFQASDEICETSVCHVPSPPFRAQRMNESVIGRRDKKRPLSVYYCMDADFRFCYKRHAAFASQHKGCLFFSVCFTQLLSVI
jgi:hypothetical protein